MVYRGHIKDGQIVIDEPCTLPEGTEVQVHVVAEGAPIKGEEPQPSLYDRLKPLVGSIKGLPADFAAEHDHYIHGTDKRS